MIKNLYRVLHLTALNEPIAKLKLLIKKTWKQVKEQVRENKVAGFELILYTFG